jgi:hypothetical protein
MSDTNLPVERSLSHRSRKSIKWQRGDGVRFDESRDPCCRHSHSRHCHSHSYECDHTHVEHAHIEHNAHDLRGSLRRPLPGRVSRRVSPEWRSTPSPRTRRCSTFASLPASACLLRHSTSSACLYLHAVMYTASHLDPMNRTPRSDPSAIDPTVRRRPLYFQTAMRRPYKTCGKFGLKRASSLRAQRPSPFA